jgi:RNA 3'-terminal phosphate cyclase (ATP)
MSEDHIHIDGSFGEGGGQIVRSSVSLSAVTGRPLTITNVRAGRKSPGLKRQHVTAVTATARVCGAHVRGATIGSDRLDFEPGEIQAGDYEFSVGSAGSATLVLQTVLPALLVAGGPSRVTLSGGTHNPWAPTFDFLDRVFLPLVNRMGPTVRATIDRPGFYPAGGGRFEVTIEPGHRLRGIDLLERGKISQESVRALVARLPRHIGQRECDTIVRKLGWPKSCGSVIEVSDSAGPGNAVMIEIESEHVSAIFTGFGQRGVKAEKVAAGAAREARRYLAAEVPVDGHLADQLMLPLGLAAYRGGQGGSFRTLSLSKHAQTHAELLRRFLGVEIVAEEVTSDETVVTIG